MYMVGLLSCHSLVYSLVHDMKGGNCIDNAQGHMQLLSTVMEALEIDVDFFSKGGRPWIWVRLWIAVRGCHRGAYRALITYNGWPSQRYC